MARGDLIHLDFALLGDLSARVNEGGLVVDFVTAQGARAVRSADLVVRDANARVLPAWIEGLTLTAGGGIRIVVDVRDTAWPIEVDPLATSPSWTAEGDQAAAMFGASVSSAGDVNGDGHSDVIVGAYRFDNGSTDEGRAFVYYGNEGDRLWRH